jgi:hypothetical protein
MKHEDEFHDIKATYLWNYMNLIGEVSNPHL